MQDENVAYFKRRAAEERVLANAGGSAADCHRRMAESYEALARDLEHQASGPTVADRGSLSEAG